MTTYSPTSIDVTALPGIFAYGDLVGGQTALETSDGDTSYAEVSHTSLADDTPTRHTFRWGGLTGVLPGTTITIEADWATDEVSRAAGFSFGAINGSFGATLGVIAKFAGVAKPYGAVQYTLPSWMAESYADLFTEDALWFFTCGTPEVNSGPVSIRVTRLTLIVEGGTVVSRVRHFPVSGWNTPPNPMSRVDETNSGSRIGPTAIR